MTDEMMSHLLRTARAAALTQTFATAEEAIRRIVDDAFGKGATVDLETEADVWEAYLGTRWILFAGD